MLKTNKFIKISSIIYLISAIFIIPYLNTYGGIQLCLGIGLLAYSFLSIEELINKKVLLIILAIISIFLNFVSAILLFIAFDELSRFKDNNKISSSEEISSETKKVDLLLKIGLGMVFASGIILTTTSWEAISDIIKCIGLVLVGVLFIGLSKFSETKLKIEKTTKAYYILGLFFFLLTLVGIGVFGTFSEWFSYTGEGKNLVYFCTFTLLSILTFLIYKKFNQKEYKYISYSILPLSLYHILLFIGLNIELTILVISAITITINILIKDSKLKDITNISEIISYIIWPILLIQKTNDLNIIVIITSIINIINIIYLTLKNTDNFNNIISTIISYILITNIALRLQSDNANIILFIIATIFYILVNHNKINSSKYIKITNQIIYNILITSTLFTISDDSLKLFICSIIYALVNFISCYITNKEDSKFDIYYQPIVLLITVASICQILGELININMIYEFSICIIIYTLINFISKDKKIQKIYYIYLIIITILTLLINAESKSIISSILTILSSLYIFKEKKHSIWSYILILVSILFLRGTLAKYIPIITTNIINIIIFIILTYILKNNIKLKRINLFAMLIPMYSLINSQGIYGEIKTILLNIYAFYILFLVLTLFVKENKTKDILTTIYTSVIILFVIFKSSLLIGLYVGIIGICIIFITYNKKDYKSSFYCGIVITILNIIIQLGEYWSKIPFGLYLLIAGIAIIGFVTIKELKKQKEPQQKTKEELTKKAYDISKNEIIQERKSKFCNKCGTKNENNNFCKNCGNNLIIRNPENILHKNIKN